VIRLNRLACDDPRATRLALYIVVGLCLLSFGRGIYELGEQSLWWDESLSHYRATQPFSFILSNQIYLKSGQRDIRTLDNHPPLYFMLLRVLVLAGGESEFTLRFLSLAAGTLVVPLLYLCGRRLFAPPSGVMAALLGALSPLYLWYQQEARPYALLTLFATVSFYALLRVRAALDLPGKGLARWSIGYVLAVIAMLTTHYLGFFLLSVEAILLAITWWQARRRLAWLVIGVGVVAVALLAWGLVALPEQAQLPGYNVIPLADLLADVFQQFTLGLYADALAPFRWAAIALLVAGTVLLLAQRLPWEHLAFCLLGLLLPILETYAVSFVRPLYMNVRHVIFSSPFYYLLLGGIAGRSWSVRLRRPPALRGIRPGVAMTLWVAAVVAGMAWATTLHYSSPDHAKEDHRAWGRYLSRHVRPEDLVIVNPGPISELYTYYAERTLPAGRSLPARRSLPAGRSLPAWFGLPFLGGDDRDTLAYLEQLPQRYDRVWVAHSSTPAWANPGNVPLTWLEAHALRTAFASFESPNTTVQAHGFLLNEPASDELPGGHATSAGCVPAQFSFDDELQLLCLDLPAEPVPAGEVLHLSLYWRAQRPLQRDYRVTASLVNSGDEAGETSVFTWSSHDYAPVSDAYPTSRWPVGRFVRDDADVDVPYGTPPGTYRLRLSVYPADRSGPALAVRDIATGELQGLIVAVAQVEVARPGQPPRPDKVDVEHVVSRRYGDLALLGHSNDGGTVHPGDVIRLDAYWKAVRAPRQDVAFRLQLVDGQGRVHVSRLVPPAGDYAPARWGKGEIVSGQYRLRVPIDAPEGAYTVYITPAQERAGWPWSVRRGPLSAIAVRAPEGERTFEVPPMQVTLRANLNDEVELLGYDLERATVQAGQVVSCTLYWRALGAIERSYTVFTHLTDADGRTWGQWDNQPQQGRAPTTRWIPGQVIADPYHIPVSADAPPGPLELRVGMYELRTMTRLPVRDADGVAIGDSIAVTELEVTGP
jgi:hypothetical protein